jgi:hypothetical protein
VRRPREDDEDIPIKKRIPKLLPLIVLRDARIKALIRMGVTKSRRQAAIVENERFYLAKEVNYWRKKSRALLKLLDKGQVLRKQRKLDKDAIE